MSIASSPAATGTPGQPARLLARVGRWYARNDRLVLGIAGILMVLIPWEILARVGLLREVLASSPTSIAEAFVDEFTRGMIWTHLWASFRVWLVGFTFASVVGIALGIFAGWYRRLRLVTVPWLQAVYAAPDLAFVPIFILWFGLGLPFKVWLVFIGVVIFVTLNTIAGVEATEGRFLAVARTYGASRTHIFRTIVLPGSVPYVMTGLRVASGRAIVGVVGAEFVASNEGIGYLITIAGSTLQTSRVFIGLVVLAAFGIALNELLGRVEQRFDAWRREVNA